MSVPIPSIPGVYIDWDDQSGISIPSAEEYSEIPMICSVFSSDKGSEDWEELSGHEWFDMYAKNNIIDSEKHGQALLQTAMAINSGAKVLSKRVVADDATLANITVVARLKINESQKVDTEGNKLFLDSNGNETTVADGNAPVLISNKQLSYNYIAIPDKKNINEIKTEVDKKVEELRSKLDASERIYPIWIFTDNGRGRSEKRIRISPNYTLSKNYNDFFLYDFHIIEGLRTFPAIHFTLNPDTVFDDNNISLLYKINVKNSQLCMYQYDDEIRTLLDELSAVSGLMNSDNIYVNDLIFGKNKKGDPIEGLEFDCETGGVDLSIINGQILMYGDNGSFGDKPYLTETYAKQVAKAFSGYVESPGVDPMNHTILTSKDGCYDPVIYNVDQYKIDLILDANYPPIVKKSIIQLVNFREDCMFLCDLGTDMNTIETVKTWYGKMADKIDSKFVSCNVLYYDVFDPFSKKQITVTYTYSIAQMITNHFLRGRNLPMAGIKYGFVIRDAIEGTVGYIPTTCPGVNEKEDLIDMRINYGTYLDNQLVIETLYTGQKKFSQLSFSNNVLAVQEIVKVIRTRCPASRYTFIDGEDLNKYRAEIESFIEPYRNQFKMLKIEYFQDEYYEINKIFYASLEFQFRDFVQSEYFKITALSNSTKI